MAITPLSGGFLRPTGTTSCTSKGGHQPHHLQWPSYFGVAGMAQGLRAGSPAWGLGGSPTPTGSTPGPCSDSGPFPALISAKRWVQVGDAHGEGLAPDHLGCAKVYPNAPAWHSTCRAAAHKASKPGPASATPSSPVPAKQSSSQQQRAPIRGGQAAGFGKPSGPRR